MRENAAMKVLFVCMGNICRSPTAEGVFRHKVKAAGLADVIAIASAGTHDYHVGHPPDARSQRHAMRRGYDLSAQRARHLQVTDFAQFDLVLTMDAANQTLAVSMSPPAYMHKVRRISEFFSRHDDTVVPDPYYGGDAGFEHVLDLLEDAADGLLAHHMRSSGATDVSPSGG